MTSDFIPAQHPRDLDGKFATKPGAEMAGGLDALTDQGAPRRLELRTCRNADGSQFHPLLAGFTEDQRAALNRILFNAVDYDENHLEDRFENGDDEEIERAKAELEESKAMYAMLFGDGPKDIDISSAIRAENVSTEASHVYGVRSIAKVGKRIAPDATYLSVYWSDENERYEPLALVDADKQPIDDLADLWTSDPETADELQESCMFLDRHQWDYDMTVDPEPVMGAPDLYIDLDKAANAGWAK